MSGDESFRALRGDGEKLTDSKRAGEAAAQGFALHVLHDHEEFVAVFEDVIDGGDMRVIEAGNPLGFFPEALTQFGIGAKRKPSYLLADEVRGGGGGRVALGFWLCHGKKHGGL